MNIFVVEDSQSVRGLLVRRLAALPGARLIGEAAGEAQALALIEWLQPDVVLLDLSLADGGSGIRVLTQLRRHGFQGKVFVLSNESSEIYRTPCMKVGANGFYDKAYELENLMLDLDALIALEATAERANAARASALLRDGLMGMFGEAALLERLDLAAKAAQGVGAELAVYVLRAEGLAALSASYGAMRVGAALRGIARRLREVCDPADLLARHAADQFSLVLTRVDSTQSAADFAIHLDALMAEAFAQAGLPTNLRPQIGMALFPAEAVTSQALLTLAQARAYGTAQPRQAVQMAMAMAD